MDGDKGLRGWIAALSVGVLLTIIALMIEEKLRVPSAGYFRAPRTVDAKGATTERRGIVLAVDPG